MMPWISSSFYIMAALFIVPICFSKTIDEMLALPALRSNGPNCWNAALNAKQILTTIRFTTKEEFQFFLNSSLCKVLEEHESAVYGDLIAIQDNEHGDVHGFIFLDHENAFSKNSLRASDPYQIQKKESVLRLYGVYSRKCENIPNPFFPPSGCYRYTQTFRCQPLHDYISKTKTQDHHFVLYQRWIQLGKKMETALFNRRASRSMRSELKRELFALKKEVQAEKNKTFLVQSIELGMVSFENQIRFLSRPKD